ncbi:hypothetical protein Rxycam_00900 [Rubrobacter xylanophilus DSM 9941]|uniref:O-antigen ligase family protein n=1 Tax=Rubrobacter xylanophilus TaxID=49319 RepID=UPI001C64170B|nr:O-antigen ligase family protein [Rubrobacter xylanophilus]QYJ15088.1 hypothetical protein Rxycam_00900 [Rubrobacter xylanophilus DSM 9941]
MSGPDTLGKLPAGHGRLIGSSALAGLALLASWMGYRYGGYYVEGWAPVALAVAALLLALAATGALGKMRSAWSAAAAGLFTGYAAWTFLSLLWSQDLGEAWQGAGLTLLYLLTFWASLSLVANGASRRWVFVALVLGPAVVAAITLSRLVPQAEELFVNGRLLGTTGYFNAEAAFLLLPFWVAIYLAGSRRVNPLLRAASLAAAALCSQLAVLTQSRGAVLALAVSLPVFFLLSGRRLRGAMALLPAAAALAATFPGLNRVYLAGEGAALEEALRRAGPHVWLAVLAAGAWGLGWALLDARWRPSPGVARAAGAAALAAGLLFVAAGGAAFYAREGNPVRWGQERLEAFRSNDASGQEQSRYLSASGSGRLTMWRVAWEDFTRHPVLGVGTHNYEATYYRLREERAGYVRQPHSLPLEVLAERGVVGGALFFGFLGVCLAAGLRRLAGLNAEGRAQLAVAAAAVTYWLVHSGLEWFWQFPAIMMPAMIYLSLLVAPWSRREEDENTRHPGLPLRAAGVGLAVLMLATALPLYVADRYAQQSTAADNPWVALQRLETARRFNPVSSELPLREAELLEQVGDWPGATGAYAEAIRLSPEHYAPYVALAGFYERHGDTANALKLYRRALELNPLEPALQGKIRRLEEASPSSPAPG